MKDVNDLAEYEEPEFHKIAVEKVLNKDAKDLKSAISKTDKEFRDERARQLKQQIYDLWLVCETQTRIEEITGISHQRVSEIIANFTGSAQVSKSGKFRDFEQENSALRIYDIWNFSKATNEVRHFGNIPPEIIDNLLYYFVLKP